MADDTPNLPNPQSYEQILSDMLSAYAEKLGINDFNVGSVNTSFFEVVALATARASGDLFQILRDYSVDRATGEALKRLAKEYRVTPISAKATTGNISVIDTTFNKISTKVYAGANPPNVGSIQIKVSDASAFAASGSIYIGRGTPNVEGPLPYAVPPVQFGSFWIITLSTPTTKFHNLSESVILAQGGNRTVPSNTIVVSPGVGSSTDIQYSVVTTALILDGETQVDNVQVIALTPGASGNVPAGAIKSFAAPPFPGATVTNPLPFTTGSDNETDNQLRIRIKRALASIGLGTATAVKASLIGATSSDENATIVSDSLVNNIDGSATVYIDDGSGYEAKSAGVGLESIVDSALGGEAFFQLQTGGRQAPVTKAFLQTNLSAPFDLVEGDALAVVVGDITYEHVFTASDFISPGGATAFEVTASINANTALGFEATTAGGGVFVVIRAKSETNDSLRTTVPTAPGRDAAIQLGFSSNIIETLRLYKNDIPLVKDGSKAAIFTQAQQLWSPTISNGETLILSIDGTPDLSYTILDSDFVATGLYTSVAANNSLASWVEVFNAKLTGVTAAIVGEKIELASNLGTNDRAAVVVNGSSSLVTKGMFSLVEGLSSFGKTSDFSLDRNTAQFELVVPLVEGDKLSAGSVDTEATIKSGQNISGSVTLTGDAHLWLLIDNPGTIINTGVITDTVLAVSKPSANIIRYTSNVSSAFNNVQVGDYVIVWSPELATTNRIEGRVNAVTATTLDVLITATEWALVTVDPGVLFKQGFIVLRTTLAPQKFRIQAGFKTLDQIAVELQGQTENLLFTVFLDQYLKVTTTTTDTSGSLLIVTADVQAQQLQFPVGTFSQSQTSLIAFYNSGGYAGDLPLFIHSGFATGEYADPIDSFIASVVSDIDLSTRDPNELIGLLHPYGVSDAQPYGEYAQVKSMVLATISITENPYFRRAREVDRYFVANPLDFGSSDTAVLVLDNDAVNKSFEIPFYRKALTNTNVVVNPFNFDAYDVDSGPTANFSSTFGGTFDFSEYKALMQAKKVLKPPAPQTAILYRAAKWGRSGEKITVGYALPTGANQDISHTVEVGTLVKIFILLASGASSPTAIDNTTEWNVTITPNTPIAGIDQVTYTWNGIGTAPTLTLVGGEYVNITSQTGFDPANIGIFRVSTEVGFTPTATSFSVQRPNGVAVAEANIPTQVNGAISFYDAATTTAADVVDYVNANLDQFMSATLVDDGGTSGSGVITTSTFEDSDFSFDSVQLLDGINWIYTSNLSGSPQFTFKKALDLPIDVGYAFNDGEEVRLIPTTMKQVKRFISVLAVSGFTTLGSVNLVNRDKHLELATNILGSTGSIQIIGGLANLFQVPVLDAGATLDNTFMKVSVDRVAGRGIHSDQWFRLQAALTQKKNTNLASNTSVTVIGNSPSVGQSTIKLLNKSLTQRYFGTPRNNVRVQGRNFKVEKQGSLVCIGWDGVGSDPTFVRAVNFNDSLGGTANVSLVVNTNDAQYEIVTGNANFSELSIDDLITISGFAPENNGTFLVTGVSDNGKIIQVNNSVAVPEIGQAFVAGDFSASIGVSEGDTVIIGAPFAVLNQGRFRVIRQYNNSFWIENPNVVEEEVTLPANPVNLGFNATTEFYLDVSGGVARLGWTGVGTEPSLGNATLGDNITLGTDFLVVNRGTFAVVKASPKLQQIATLTFPSGADFGLGGAGKYFKVSNAGNVNQYYIWYNVNGGNSDPGPVVGFTPVMVSILSGDTDVQVAAKTALAISGGTTGLSVAASGPQIIMTTTGFAETNDPLDVTMPVQFDANVTQQGTRTYLEFINPSAVNEPSVLILAGILQANRSQMQFWEYEATVVGDSFVATGNILTTQNAGSYVVLQVLDKNTAIVDGGMASVTNVSLNNNTTAIYIEEGVPYSGYKHVYLVSQEPDSVARNILVFDTNAQYGKINGSSATQLTSLSKLNFNTTIKNGLDSYRYNTGLIAEANRIIYGDPRDSVTYPGVGAAGADIFTREPLILRVQVAVDVRLLTGVPFNVVSQQVRSNISSLINANPVGQSIDISSIIGVVRSIPGVQSVAISSPQYDSTHDLIKVVPSQKARIIDSTVDISVSQIGS